MYTNRQPMQQQIRARDPVKYDEDALAADDASPQEVIAKDCPQSQRCMVGTSPFEIMKVLKTPAFKDLKLGQRTKLGLVAVMFANATRDNAEGLLKSDKYATVAKALDKHCTVTGAGKGFNMNFMALLGMMIGKFGETTTEKETEICRQYRAKLRKMNMGSDLWSDEAFQVLNAGNLTQQQEIWRKKIAEVSEASVLKCEEELKAYFKDTLVLTL